MDPSKTPAAPPPPGVTPNFANPSGSEYDIYSISIAMCSTATVVLLGRLYTRGFILNALGLDDGASCQRTNGSKEWVLTAGFFSMLYLGTDLRLDLRHIEHCQ